MIDPKELRIGNYFQWSPFASMGKGIDKITHGQQIMDYAELKDPIDLTPEWLERAGWNYYNGKSSGDMTMDTSCKIDLDWVDGRMKLKGHYEPAETYRIIPIKHVHQLQNLYYALTGTELEFKL